MRSFLRPLCLAALSSLPLWAGTAQAQSKPDKPAAPPPFFVEAADCTAAFKASVNQHLTQAKTQSRDRAIYDDTERGFVYIGVAYKQGLRSPEADHMLAAAEKRWAQLDKEEQASRLAACTKKAGDLMDEVTFIERYIVRNRARARVDRLLSQEKKS